MTEALPSWSAARDEAHRQGARPATRPQPLLLAGALGSTLAALIAVVPIVVACLFLQKYFVRGLVGAEKG